MTKELKELPKKESIKIKCPLCKEKIPSTAMRCSKCTGDLDNELAQKDIQLQLQGQEGFVQLMKRRPILTGILLILIVWTFGGMLFGGDSGSSQPQTKQESKSSFLSIGEDGILNNNKTKTDCEGGSILATNKDNADKFTKTLVADDRLGYLQMLGDGQIFSVANCTKIKKIGGSFSLSEVRILEGEYLGTSGWIAVEFAIKE